MTVMKNLPRRVVLAVTAIGLIGAWASVAAANCEVSQQHIRDEQLELFEKAPAEILSSYPKGGYSMEVAVGEVVAHAPDTLRSLSIIYQRGSLEQVQALGIGLWLFVGACPSDQATGKAILSFIASAGSTELGQAFWQQQTADAVVPTAGSRSPTKKKVATSEMNISIDADPSRPLQVRPLSDPFAPPGQLH